MSIVYPADSEARSWAVAGWAAVVSEVHSDVFAGGSADELMRLVDLRNPTDEPRPQWLDDELRKFAEKRLEGRR